MMVKLQAQEVHRWPQFPSDIWYRHCGLLRQFLKMMTFAHEIFEEILMFIMQTLIRYCNIK